MLVWLAFLTGLRSQDVVVEAISDTEATAGYVLGNAFAAAGLASVTVNSTLGAFVATFDR